MKESVPVVARKPTPEYGNWVSKRLVYVPAGIGVVCIVLAAWVLAFAVPAAVFLLVAAYFAYARYLFAPNGADVQGSVWSTLLEHLEWDGYGRAIDIGCGSAALSIRLAKKYPGAKITGVDHWGERWEYSKALCERNATTEGVGERTTFQKASASSLPFPDESFDAVVSNLVFHEVSDVPDKQQLIREALRVVRKGGAFAIQDLFLIRRMYGDIDVLLGTIRSWGVTKVKFVETRKAPFIPLALKLPFMVGTMGLIVGEK